MEGMGWRGGGGRHRVAGSGWNTGGGRCGGRQGLAGRGGQAEVADRGEEGRGVRQGWKVQGGQT